MSLNQLVTESLRLEGERFKLFKRIDKCRSVYEYPSLQKELYEMNVKIEQYHQAIKDLQQLSQIKRRMLR